MNAIYPSIWNDKTGALATASGLGKSPDNDPNKGASPGKSARIGRQRFALKTLAISLMMAFGANVYALPVGGVVAAGDAVIGDSVAGSKTITQSSQNVAINWLNFSIGLGESVRFVQPNSNSIALNRVLGPDPSSILGNLSANGKVFLLNPNGILFGSGAQVNVGGLVASTLNMSDSDFMAGRYQLSGTSSAAITNQGTINADGGYVALLGANVSNDGIIQARLGTVTLAAGNAMTLDVAGDGLLNVTVSQGAVNALIQNGGLIQADGGQVLLTAKSAGNLLLSAVNNTGVIQAQTIENRNGTIKLMGDMQNGTVNVGGTLDASAPNGGDGGFIETSAAHVKIQDSAHITTAAPNGMTGTWLIDPVDFTIQAGFDISGAALSAQLVDNNIVITTVAGPGAGNGDIFVNEAVVWNGALGVSAVPTTLTLNALRDVNIGRNSLGAVDPTAVITATNGNVVVCCGRDVNVFAAITTTDGSVLLAAGNDVNLNAAMTTTRGNMALCAGNDINLNGVPAAIVLTDIAAAPERSLGLADGLTLSAGTNGTGPGAAGGTLNFALATPPAAITRAPVAIYYNPVSYAAPTDYSGATFFTLVGPGAPVTQFMLVFPDGANKTFDGTTTTTFTSLKGAPPGVTLGGAGTANFDTADVGDDKVVTFSGFTLGGPGAGNYAFANSCCAPFVSKTTANIIAALPVVPPVPPVVVPIEPIAESIEEVGPAAEEMMGYDGGITPAQTLLIGPTSLPVVQLGSLPPQLLSVAPVVVPPAQVIVPAETPPEIYVPPVRVRKQDRN